MGRDDGEFKARLEPVFVSDDRSEGAQALIARGAVPVRTLSGLDDLQPAQLQF